ncbi:hypothetical protein [Halomonas mongoliensis]|uniref:hypothetical protein n=1 Tax=Halomonas mongoliensis TaxID=321265 RepID=UPI00403B136B
MTRYISWGLFTVLMFFVLLGAWLYASKGGSRHSVVLSSAEARYFADLPDAVVEEISTYASRLLGVSEEEVFFQSGRVKESFWTAFYYQNSHPIPDEVDINEVINGSVCDSSIRQVMSAHMITDLSFVIKPYGEMVSVIRCLQSYSVR